MGKATRAGEFAHALHIWEEMAIGMSQYFENYDILLTPTVAYPPIRIGHLDLGKAKTLVIKLLERLGLLSILKTSGIAMKIALESIKYTPFTQVANVAGLPAMSVPTSWTDQGLPIGVQFIAPFGDEKSLFQLARQIEIARPWDKVAQNG